MRVLIAGAGIAGLTAALSLHAAGIADGLYSSARAQTAPGRAAAVKIVLAACDMPVERVIDMVQALARTASAGSRTC